LNPKIARLSLLGLLGTSPTSPGCWGFFFHFEDLIGRLREMLLLLMEGGREKELALACFELKRWNGALLACNGGGS
jgi:hypothetical protein